MTRSAELPEAVSRLLSLLDDFPRGHVVDPSPHLIQTLGEAWNHFGNSSTTKMAPRKLERIEEIKWDPPNLSFRIERHGATVMGSSRAEIQEWVLDLNQLTAEYWGGRYRQIYARDAPLKTLPLAQEVADLIATSAEDERIKWISPSKFRLRIGLVIPETVKQTTSQRRKRFSRQLSELLEKQGWRRDLTSVAHTYIKSDDA